MDSNCDSKLLYVELKELRLLSSDALRELCVANCDRKLLYSELKELGLLSSDALRELCADAPCSDCDSDTLKSSLSSEDTVTDDAREGTYTEPASGTDGSLIIRASRLKSMWLRPTSQRPMLLRAPDLSVVSEVRKQITVWFAK